MACFKKWCVKGLGLMDDWNGRRWRSPKSERESISVAGVLLRMSLSLDTPENDD